MGYLEIKNNCCDITIDFRKIKGCVKTTGKFPEEMNQEDIADIAEFIIRSIDDVYEKFNKEILIKYPNLDKLDIRLTYESE